MSVERILMEYRKIFYRIYHSEISPILANFESKRQEYLDKMKFYMGIAGIALAVFVVLGITSPCSSIPWQWICSALSLVAFCIIPFKMNSSYTKELKSYCYRPILKIFGEINWIPEGFSDTELERSMLFSYYNRRRDDDCFEGTYKGVQFGIDELHLGHESGSGKHRHYHVVFEGVAVKFASNKDIKAKTIIATKGDSTGRGKAFSFLIVSIVAGLQIAAGMEFSKWSLIFLAAFILIGLIVSIIMRIKGTDTNGLNPVKLEDPEFNRKYNVYSEDEVEARYLITTAFMERFKNMKTSFGAKRAKCSFYDGNVMFAIATNKNVFEIGNLFKKPNDTKQLENFFNEFSSVLLLVDYFKLDKKLGL